MRRFFVFGLIIAALVLAACGGAGPEPTTAPEPAQQPAEQATVATAPEPAATAVEPTAAPEPTVAVEATAAPEPTEASMPAMAEATVMDGKIMLPEVNPLEVSGDIIVGWLLDRLPAGGGVG